MNVVLLKARLGQKGGLEKYAHLIASAFLAKGANVTFLTAQEPPKNLFEPLLSIQAFPVCRWPAFLRLEQFDRCVRRWLKKNPADVVFGMERNRVQTHLRAGNGVHAAYLKSRLAAEGRIKYAICQINPLHRKILELEKEAFEYPGLKKLFVNSHMVRQQVLDHYAADPGKIEVVHNGVEWKERSADFASWEQGRKAALAKFDLDPNTLHLLFIGNGYKRKGLDKLLEALAIRRCKDFHLSVVGKEKQIEKYRAKLIELGLEKRVRFFGPQDSVLPFYQLADVLMIPSFYDPFANVTVEALAMGLFVISSKTNGGHEILTKQNGAIIEDLLDIESIAASLDLAFRKTPASASAIRETVSHLDFSRQLSKLVDVCG